MDLLDDPGSVWPTIDWQGEGGLTDEHIALDRLERSAGRVRLALIVARDDPDAPLMLDSYLRRPEDMSCGMQRYRGASERQRCPVFDGLEIPIPAQTLSRDTRARTCENVAGATMAQVVAVTMCDDRGLHRLPGVNVEITGWAIEPVRSDDDERFGIGTHE